MIDLPALKESIRKHEGYRETPYRDSLKLWTVGTGKLIDDMRIPETCRTIGDVMDWICNPIRHANWLADDVAQAVKDAEQFIGSAWNTLTDAQQRVVSEMAYQLGASRLAGFVKFRLALVHNNIAEAKREGRNSAWAKQTPQRANELMDLL